MSSLVPLKNSVQTEIISESKVMTVEGSTDKFIFILFFFSFLLLLFVFDGRNEPRTHNNTHTKQKTYISKKDKPVPLCVAIFLRMRYNPPPLLSLSRFCSLFWLRTQFALFRCYVFFLVQTKKNKLVDGRSLRVAPPLSSFTQ